MKSILLLFGAFTCAGMLSYSCSETDDDVFVQNHRNARSMMDAAYPIMLKKMTRRVTLEKSNTTGRWYWRVDWLDEDGDIVAYREGWEFYKKDAESNINSWTECPGNEYPFDPEKR